MVVAPGGRNTVHGRCRQAMRKWPAAWGNRGYSSSIVPSKTTRISLVPPSSVTVWLKPSILCASYCTGTGCGRTTLRGLTAAVQEGLEGRGPATGVGAGDPSPRIPLPPGDAASAESQPGAAAGSSRAPASRQPALKSQVRGSAIAWTLPPGRPLAFTTRPWAADARERPCQAAPDLTSRHTAPLQALRNASAFPLEPARSSLGAHLRGRVEHGPDDLYRPPDRAGRKCTTLSGPTAS